MSSPDRQELVRNAVTFLQDPKAQASPITQRIQFLEAKGLTPVEIDIAIKQASASPPSQGYQPGYPVNYGPAPYPMIPPHALGWDWRDYFVTAVISGSIAYGAVSLFKKYLLPHLQPPASSAYEEDRDALTAQFDIAEALLKEIRGETMAVKVAVEEQGLKIDKTTQDVVALVGEMRLAEARTRDEVREIREEVNNVREMLPKMVDRNKEHQTQTLNELQQELKSLKVLLLNRPTGVPSPSPSPLPPMPRATIPAWQLAGSTGTSAAPGGTSVITESPITAVPTPMYPASPNGMSIGNGKGKQVETDASTPSSLPTS